MSMQSRYDTIDDTKWDLVQIRVSHDLKMRMKSACRVNDTDMSELTRSFWKAWLTSEQYDPQPAPIHNRFDWALERVYRFFGTRQQHHLYH